MEIDIKIRQRFIKDDNINFVKEINEMLFIEETL